MGRFDNIDDSNLSLEELNIKYPTYVISEHPNYFETMIENDLVIRIFNDDGNIPRFYVKNINSEDFSIIDIVDLKYNIENKILLNDIDKNNLSEWLTQLAASEELIDKLPFLKRNNWKCLAEIWMGMGNYPANISKIANLDTPIINF